MKLITTVYGKDGEHDTPYLTRIVLGRLRIHIFHRGDVDPDPHDHMWDFWTFPLTSYVEEVIPFASPLYGAIGSRQVVRAWRLHKRKAEHTHRVLGKWKAWHHEYGHYTEPGKVITIVWAGERRRRWGFHTPTGWVYWRDYIFPRKAAGE